MKGMLVGAFALVGIAGSVAVAADLPAKALPPVVRAGYSWTGLYLGINGGYGWGTADHTALLGSSAVAPPFSSIGGVPGATFSHAYDGGIFGGHLGFNYQWSSFVLGLEGSVAWTDLKGSNTTNVVFTVPPGPQNTYSAKLNWLATLTPRAGLAVSNWLLYAKGGLAAGQTDFSLSRDTGGFAGAVISGTQSRLGWTIGAGFEYAFAQNWILGLEYNYVDLGTDDYGGNVLTPAGTFTVGFTESLQLQFSQVLGRISYKF